jgi:GH15 family glucan-1,4-alpha-glucosidase
MTASQRIKVGVHERHDRRVPVRRIVAVGAALALAAATAAATTAATRQLPQPKLTVAGLAQEPCQPQQALPVPARLSGQFEPDSSILRVAGGVYAAPGQAAPAQSACVTATERADRNWLNTGLVPGATATQRSMATRALLDLSLAVRPDGAAQAGWLSGSEYEYAWPRDSSWVAVALTDAGHPAMAYRILEFLHRMQGRNGIWAARYAPDGSGPVRDGRPAELDADGWVPWAVWSWAVTQPLTSQSHHELTRLWPMVVRAADAAVRSLTDDGLSGPAMDYWEDSVEVTLGTAAPLLAGLRAAADLAPDVGSATATSDGHRWAAAAARLATAITATFGRNGYQRTPAAGSGADAAVTFLGPPFAVPSAAVLQAARSAQRALTVPNGGLRPGTSWPGTPDVAWTPETAFFALFDASTGQHGQAAALLAWLAAHRTRLGSLPEQVNSSGQPASVAPLAWTDAVTLLALLAQAGHLPTIPVPSPGQ